MTSRTIGALTSPEIVRSLKPTSILLLPLGAIEQHGPHLPLDTDLVVAQGLTRRLVERWGEEFDLWELPAIPIGLSREHDWAPGTLSLSIQGFVALMRDLAGSLVCSLPARNLVIVNGHGGNRGILDNLLHEFRGDFALNACVIHPFDLCKQPTGEPGPDVHGGIGETSVMLALAPERVRLDLVADASSDAAAVRALIFDRGVSFPWRSDDRRLTGNGAIGDARAATAELGAAMIASVLAEARGVLARLLENQKLMR
jgi:creatinine amidohydrolase/Fe(II)-dependent formamide hydrolase-like protein